MSKRLEVTDVILLTNVLKIKKAVPNFYVISNLDNDHTSNNSAFKNVRSGKMGKNIRLLKYTLLAKNWF